MKQLFSIILLFVAFSAQAQIVKIDIDSISDNQIILQSKKWGATNDTIRLITTKIQTVYGDSTNGNVTIVIEWKLDSTKSVKIREKQILDEKRQKRRELQAQLDKFDIANPDAKAAKQAAKLGMITEAPKSYSLVTENPNFVLKIDKPKKKWYRTKRKK